MKKVQSFDVFDTLIARKCKEPTDLFDVIEKNLPCRHFKALRIEAQRIAGAKKGIYMNIDDIYDEYKALNDLADTDMLKKAELDFEYEYSIPIVSNIKKIKPGDIYISDMYLKKEQIYKLLSKHKIDTTNALYVTNGGKSNGTIYEEIKRTHHITLHTGDNEQSDIEMAKKYKINTHHTTLSTFTDTETILFNMKLIDLQQSIREYRLKNPYAEKTREFDLYNEQAKFNIPLLVLFCVQINEIMIKEKRNKILFVTRDCCLLIHMFQKFFPQYTSVYFSASRHIHTNPSPSYKEYVKSHYTTATLIIDLHGSFLSGRPLYWELFGDIPRVHYLVHSNPKPFCPRITGCIMANDPIVNYCYVEALNYDLKGTLIGMVDGRELRMYNENDHASITLYHKVFLEYLETIKYSIYAIQTSIPTVALQIVTLLRNDITFCMDSPLKQPVV